MLASLVTGMMCAGMLQSAPSDARSVDWRTHAERTGFAETGRYTEVVEWCERLAAQGDRLRVRSLGTSPEGRDIPLIVVSADGSFTPEAARSSSRPLVMIQCCIHAGECEGKDACLVLLRDLIAGPPDDGAPVYAPQTRVARDLPERVNLLVIPIFNVDGHERFGPHNRINQDGPAESGWRTSAQNLNLNRDYMKADTPEMRGWLRTWHAWQPDLFIDTHTTDGEEHRYDLFYSVTDGPPAPEAVAAWTRDVLLPPVVAGMDGDGYHTLPYGWLKDRKDPTRGWVLQGSDMPRLSTGYVGLAGRPAVLVETHARNPYGQRVRATYDFIRHVLNNVAERPEALRTAVRTADEDAVKQRGAGSGGTVPLRLERTDDSKPFTYRGFELRVRPSEISGGDVIEYTARPRDYASVLFPDTRVSAALEPPAAYLIPQQWTEVLERLKLHGVRTTRLAEARTLEVETYRFEEVTYDKPHEGRTLPRYKAVLARETRTFPAATVVVPLDQPRARLAVHLLEPPAPDSLAVWGFFNAVLERKEYAETYVLEPLARKMLAEDPALRREFETQLKDPEFARSPARRLEFFLDRSPHRDAQYNAYPVARALESENVKR